MEEMLPVQQTPDRKVLYKKLLVVSLITLLAGGAGYAWFMYVRNSSILPRESANTSQSTESTSSLFGSDKSSECVALNINENDIKKGMLLDFDATQKLIKVDIDVYPELYLVAGTRTKVYMMNRNCEQVGVDEFSNISKGTTIGLLKNTNLPGDGIILFNTVPVDDAKLLLDANLVIYVY